MLASPKRAPRREVVELEHLVARFALEGVAATRTAWLPQGTGEATLRPKRDHSAKDMPPWAGSTSLPPVGASAELPAC